MASNVKHFLLCAMPICTYSEKCLFIWDKYLISSSLIRVSHLVIKDIVTTLLSNNEKTEITSEYWVSLSGYQVKIKLL